MVIYVGHYFFFINFEYNMVKCFTINPAMVMVQTASHTLPPQLLLLFLGGDIIYSAFSTFTSVKVNINRDSNWYWVFYTSMLRLLLSLPYNALLITLLSVV